MHQFIFKVLVSSFFFSRSFHFDQADIFFALWSISAIFTCLFKAVPERFVESNVRFLLDELNERYIIDLFQFVFIVLSADSCIETPINLGSNPDAIMSFLQDPEKQLLRWQDSSDNPSTPAVKKHKATLSRRLSLESDETVESSPSREASSDFLCKSNTTVTFL